ncbi:MAG: ABC transporter permease, partial [Actinomycetales bacterium]
MRTTLSELGASLSRNKSMTISLVVTMTVSLLLAALGLLIQSQADRTEKYFGDRLQLQVNLCTKNSPSATCLGGVATDEQKQAVQDALDENPEVKSFDVRSPADNYSRAKEILGQSETGRKQLETLGPDAFPETYYVTLKDPQEFDGVVSQVSGMDGVGTVSSLRKLLGPLFEILDKMRWAALATSLLLIVAAILQVSNTIR